MLCTGIMLCLCDNNVSPCDNERCRFLGVSLSVSGYLSEAERSSGRPTSEMCHVVATPPTACKPIGERFVLPDIQAVDLLDCNKDGLTQLDQWLLAVKIDLAAASRLIRTGRPVATNKPIPSPAFIATGNSTREAEEQVLALRAK